MPDEFSLHRVLESARRECPGPLPADFAAGVMRHLQEQGSPLPSRGARLWAAAAIAAVVVATAGGIGWWTASGEKSTVPPRLGMFGSQPSHSPFARP